MSDKTRKRTRRVFVVALLGSLCGSLMYVSFAMGFRQGIMEDTVFIMQQC